LPFIVQQCEFEEKLKTYEEKMEAASDLVNPSDTTDITFDNQNNTALSEPDTGFVESDTLIPPVKRNRSLFEKFCSPDDKNLSGVGFIVMYYFYILLFASIPTAFSMIVVCLYRRSFKKYWNDRKTFTYTAIALAGLLILLILHHNHIKDLKTGYWLALLFNSIAFVSDLLIYQQWKKNNKLFYDNNH
jgi:hypothetical protein